MRSQAGRVRRRCQLVRRSSQSQAGATNRDEEPAVSEKIPGLPFELEWEGDPAGGASADGTIELAAPGATDMFFDPGGPTRLMNVPRLIGPAPAGDFQLSVKATVGLLATFDAGAIVLVRDEHHWAKLLLERSVAGAATVVSVVTRGVSDDCDSFTTDQSHIWLRVSRLSEAFAFNASLDGRVWRFVRYFSLACEHGDNDAPLLIGFEAQSPTGEGAVARFSEITFVAERLADMRSGV
jgi:hypothetical protein